MKVGGMAGGMGLPVFRGRELNQMKRGLHPFPLDEAMKALSGGTPRAIVMTMSEGQWDVVLANAYELGWILLELDEDERPLRAYRKAVA